MDATNFTTTSKITWCPGCPNGSILVAYRQALAELTSENLLESKNVVTFSGIGCHGKISDYVNTNSFTALHGRLIPAMTGTKCANSNLTVVGFSGDGDSYSEGIEHLVHAAKRNSDISLFIHDNRVFALTTGQADALSPKGFIGKSTPFGNLEEPFNPLLMVLSAGATFVARTYAGEIQKTKDIMMAAISHKGFSYVDIIQPCITFFDTRDYFKDHVYWIDDNIPNNDFDVAIKKVGETGDKIPLGVFYKTEKKTFEEQLNG